MVALLGGLGLRKTEKFRLLNQQMKIKCGNQIECNVIWEHNKTHLLQPWAKKAEDLITRVLSSRESESPCPSKHARLGSWPWWEIVEL